MSASRVCSGIVCVVVAVGLLAFSGAPEETLAVGFGETEISPVLKERPVYIAGFGHNRKATRLNDPLHARAVVLRDGRKKIALVSVDLIGFFHANVLNVRKQLPGFDYVLVSSTHTHEGPDTLGLWGSTPVTSGVDADYLKAVEDGIVRAVRQADSACIPVRAEIGTVKAPDLLIDNREPYLKHDDLVVLRCTSLKDAKPAGIVVQWNCHPETLDPESTALSADYVGVTVKALRERYRCPAAYFTGTVGGLMTTMRLEVKDAEGKRLDEGSRAKTERYGTLLAERASKAIEAAKPLKMTPFEVRTRDVFLPLENPLYVFGKRIGLFRREGYLWAGDPGKAERAADDEAKKPLAIRTEVGYLRLGDLEVAAIPGEVYPELVLARVQTPADPGADFPDAPAEPGIYRQMRGPHRMILGLANDEIGYIIPKRQWDVKAPYCYGRTKPQYGEQNSTGPEAAPILCGAFAELVKGK